MKLFSKYDFLDIPLPPPGKLKYKRIYWSDESSKRSWTASSGFGTYRLCEQPRSLARTFAARSYKHWVKTNLQTESQIPGPFEWLGMRS